ncbi:MAG: hypothetical protein KDC24_01110 [Saprospiraceae bacterium]|nr:hypothetical protein [Saprospiraceae bacterium]
MRFALGLFVMAATLFFATEMSAQKVVMKSGKFDALKGQDEINVSYRYDNMGVGKFDHEEDYVDEKVREKNEDEPGSGDEWKRKWEDDREARFEPKFEELMTEYLKDQGTKVGRYPYAKYTLVIHTTFTEPGFNVGVMRKPAMINANISLVETDNMDKELAKATIEKVPGRDAMGYDFDTGYRLQEAYAKLGKTFAKYLVKKVF